MYENIYQIKSFLQMALEKMSFKLKINLSFSIFCLIFQNNLEKKKMSEKASGDCVFLSK